MTQSEPSRPGAPDSLSRAVGSGGYFTLAFGAIVGSGWIVVLGEWLRVAGPGGTVLAFLAGGIVMLLIGTCYAELAARLPRAGGEFLYVLETLGSRAGFVVGWYLTLYAVAVCAFEAIALGWILHVLLPFGTLGTLYEIRGQPVTGEALIAGSVGAVALAVVHLRGAHVAIRFQNAVTFGFIMLVTALIAVAIALGHRGNLRPVFASLGPESWSLGGVWTFGTCAFFLNGWQSALHAMEERRADVGIARAVWSVMFAIVAAAVFYSMIVVAAASAIPWPTLVQQDLPAVAAFSALTPGGVLGTVILVAAAISLLKTWSAMIWVASRLIYALARHGFVPAGCGRLRGSSGAPVSALLLVTLTTLMGVAAGRGAVMPIVNMVSTCMAVSYLLCVVVLLRRRRSGHEEPEFTVPGGGAFILVALIGAAAMVGIALAEPWIHRRNPVPTEWLALIGWGVAGIVAWRIAGSSARRAHLRAITARDRHGGEA